LELQTGLSRFVINTRPGFHQGASGTEQKERHGRGTARETRVRQSDKLIILIVRRDTFRLRDGPQGVFLELKGRETNLPLLDGVHENLNTADGNLSVQSLHYQHGQKTRPVDTLTAKNKSKAV
jgi:hypothetical protein